MATYRSAYGDAGGSSWPPVITNVLLANVVLLLPLLFESTIYLRLLQYGALWPLGERFLPWQLVTYGFLHGGFLHFAFNMYALWIFGGEIERRWGSRTFLIYYAFCLVGSGLVQLLIATLSGGLYPTVGASGAVYGVLLAFAWLYPKREIMLLIPPIPIQARWLVLILGALSLFAGLSGGVVMPTIAHFAHLGGLLSGALLLAYWRGKLPFKPRRRPVL